MSLSLRFLGTSASRPTVERGLSSLALVREGETLLVNSRHHQAVQQPAPRLVVTATAPDGVVEAVEKPGARFCVGVEWHPENFVETGEFLPLFKGLVDASR